MKYCKLIDWRQATVKTQEKAAEALGISQQMYSKLETGARGISNDMALRLNEVTGISLKYLLPKLFDPNHKPNKKVRK